ncbi:hypothetical protein ACH492_27850 [Streptomyces sp. NPDC019443]|uniref:hypothetical protein n=1 Tax=Streptomyces sp. NPDC019443 TaxID=3365061 RepID=UPI0037ABB1FD
MPAVQEDFPWAWFFTLFSKADSNVVESAAILMEFVVAPHERWAELAARMHGT